MTSFHQIANFSINLTGKWVENCHKSCGLKSYGLNVLKVGGNVFKCCGILKY